MWHFQNVAQTTRPRFRILPNPYQAETGETSSGSPRLFQVLSEFSELFDAWNSDLSNHSVRSAYIAHQLASWLEFDSETRQRVILEALLSNCPVGPDFLNSHGICFSDSSGSEGEGSPDISELVQSAKEFERSTRMGFFLEPKTSSDSLREAMHDLRFDDAFWARLELAPRSRIGELSGNRLQARVDCRTLDEWAMVFGPMFAMREDSPTIAELSPFLQKWLGSWVGLAVLYVAA